MQKGEVPLMAVALLLRWEWSCTRPASLSKLPALCCKIASSLPSCKTNPALCSEHSPTKRAPKFCIRCWPNAANTCGDTQSSCHLKSRQHGVNWKSRPLVFERFASGWTDWAWWIASCLELWRTMLTPLSSTPGASSYCWYVENLETQHKGASWMGPVTECRTKLFITQKNKMHADLTCIGALCQDCG